MRTAYNLLKIAFPVSCHQTVKTDSQPYPIESLSPGMLSSRFMLTKYRLAILFEAKLAKYCTQFGAIDEGQRNI